MADRKKKRRFGKNDAVFALSKKFTLAPITQAEEAPKPPLLIEPAWDGLRVLATRTRYRPDTTAPREPRDHSALPKSHAE